MPRWAALDGYQERAFRQWARILISFRCVTPVQKLAVTPGQAAEAIAVRVKLRAAEEDTFMRSLVWS